MEIMDVSSDVDINVTLEDDAWKDSFDKLLGSKPALRELNLLKKEVRASFNMDSSVENFSTGSSKELLQVVSPQVELSMQSNLSEGDIFKRIKGRCGSISTPMGKQLLSKPFMGNPFKCSISPISAWKLRFCERSDRANDTVQSLDTYPIEINIVDYDKDDQNINYQTNDVLKDSLTYQQTGQIEKVEGIRTIKKPKTSRKHVFFEDIKEITQIKKNPTNRMTQPNTQRRLSSKHFATIKDRPTSLQLQPGKWRKSLNVWRRTQNAHKRISECIDLSDIADSLINPDVVMVGHRKSIFLKPHSDCVVPNINSSIVSKSIWEERVLRRCKQQRVNDFTQTYKGEEMTNCKKIGEGAYGEVFINSYDDSSQATVLKIIPIEGKDVINGEVQKSYEQILPEMVISEELSNLKENEVNSTSCYVGIKKIVCVKGKYPKHLLKLWEAYDEEKGSENDNPNILPSDQHFIVLELAYSGKDLEGFVFNSAEQSYYALQQIILTLAVGEEAFSFEHRDLHWGNILVMNTAEKNIVYKLQNKTLTLPTRGVRITIIDYTLSRMTYGDCCLYNDLSCDEELFNATGDYQFDIYRMMRDIMKNKWENFEPRTNIFWLSYLTRKMQHDVSYKNTRTKTHATFLNKLRQLESIILDFSSATECAKYLKKLKNI